jgi:hypothetical protein
MAKVTKSQIMEGLKTLGDRVQLNVETQSVVDFTLDNYNENPRNVSMDELKEVLATIQQSTGLTTSGIIYGENVSVESKPTEGKKLPNKKETENSVKTESNKPVVVPKNKNKSEDVAEDKKQDNKKATTSKVQKPHEEYLASFPETLVSESLKGTLKLRKDLVTIQDVAEAWSKNEDIVIATYWTKKLLKQYAQGYDPMGINPNRPKSFEHDLDLIEVTFANHLVVTGCSLYSYVPQILLPSDFEQDEDGMRYANGCEFQVYEIVEEE